MLWFFRWMWKRVSDWYTALDILEAAGWKAKGATMLIGLMTSAVTLWDGAPMYDVILAFIGSSLIVLGLVNLFVNFRPSWNRFQKGKPEFGYTPLLAAIIELFEEQKRGYVLQRAKQNLKAGSEVANDSQIVARHIASRIPIYGTLHDDSKISSDLRIIPKSALESHRFNDDASRLIHLFYESSYYDDLSVKTDEFEAFKISEIVDQACFED